MTKSHRRHVILPFGGSAKFQPQASLSLARPCTRVCARMTRFLLVSREGRRFRDKTNFPLVNQSFFEMKSDVLKAMISES